MTRKRTCGETFEAGGVFRSENPRHTPVRQGLDHLSLQHSDLQAKGGGCTVIQLRAEPFEACYHETNPSVDFEREISVLEDNAA